MVDRAQAGTSDADAKALKLHAATWYRFGQSAASGLSGKLVETRLSQAALLGFTGGNSPVGDSASIAPHAIGHVGPPGTVDLLRLIDLKKDVVDGTWTMGADGLKVESSAGEPPSKIRFPYAPPAEYDVNIELTRLKDGRRQLNCIRCPQGDDPYIAVIGDNGNHDTYVSGANDPSGLRTHSDPVLTDNQRNKIRLEVRKEKFSVFIDGKLSAAYALTAGQGDRNYEWWAGDRLIAFSTWSALVIHSMKVTEIGQGGMVMALGPAAGIPTLPAPLAERCAKAHRQSFAAARCATRFSRRRLRQGGRRRNRHSAGKMPGSHSIFGAGRIRLPHRLPKGRREWMGRPNLPGCGQRRGVVDGRQRQHRLRVRARQRPTLPQ